MFGEASDVMQGIQSGLLELHITATGPLGLSNRTQDDMLLPNWDNAALRERLKLRLTNERGGALLLEMPRHSAIPYCSLFLVR